MSAAGRLLCLTHFRELQETRLRQRGGNFCCVLPLLNRSIIKLVYGSSTAMLSRPNHLKNKQLWIRCKFLVQLWSLVEHKKRSETSESAPLISLFISYFWCKWNIQTLKNKPLLLVRKRNDFISFFQISQFWNSNWISKEGMIHGPPVLLVFERNITASPWQTLNICEPDIYLS